MVKIYQYQKTSDEFTQYRVQGEGVCELCTIDGVTYFSAEGELPAHSDRLTVTEPVLTDALRDQIKAESPHVALINDRIKQKIRERYGAEDEQYYSRISIGVLMGQYVYEPGELDAVLAYGAYIEGLRTWGREEKALLGLA